MFEELTLDIAVVDTQPLPSLRRPDEPTVDERPAERLFAPPRARPGSVLRLSDGSDTVSDGVRVELARHVQLLAAARDRDDAIAVSRDALRFLFGPGLRLSEAERRILGNALTGIRRRFGAVHFRRAS